jgi:adenosylmethionine---8-amino-7-oxononanoate aminotransferase
MSLDVCSLEDLIAFDQQYIWHPYTAFGAPGQILAVKSANGVRIQLQDNRELIDGISSWWSCLHGYNHPILNQAITSQLNKMAHVMFAGFTHEPAVTLAKKLVEITPTGLNKVFFSDSGSVAVEVAMKMALQYWISQQQPQRNKFLTIKQGYHGDTLATMSLCDPHSGMHHLFHQALTHQFFADAPNAAFDEDLNENNFDHFAQVLKRNKQNIAAVILEPIVQGAGGMKFYAPEYVKRVRELCDEYNLLLIADEIATGFGRTGKLFACEHADISPDIMCLGKALSAGYITLAATLCNDKVSEGISQGSASIFMHGPTYMANPLACAVANASIDLLLSQDWQSSVQKIEHQLKNELAPCKTLKNVKDVRVLGAIGVVEMENKIDTQALIPKIIEKGVWLRPFGNIIYLTPPFIITTDELTQLTKSVCEIVSEITSNTGASSVI